MSSYHSPPVVGTPEFSKPRKKRPGQIGRSVLRYLTSFHSSFFVVLAFLSAFFTHVSKFFSSYRFFPSAFNFSSMVSSFFRSALLPARYSSFTYEDNRDSWGVLKELPAGELRTADFQEVLNRLADWHDGKPPLSHFTLSNLRSSAKAAYDLAIPEVVLYNPLVKTTCPAGAAPEPREPITEEQQQWIRETPHAAQRAAMLLLYSGLRRGEATALT